MVEEQPNSDFECMKSRFVFEANNELFCLEKYLFYKLVSLGFNCIDSLKVFMYHNFYEKTPKYLGAKQLAVIASVETDSVVSNFKKQWYYTELINEPNITLQVSVFAKFQKLDDIDSSVWNIPSRNPEKHELSRARDADKKTTHFTIEAVIQKLQTEEESCWKSENTMNTTMNL